MKRMFFVGEGSAISINNLTAYGRQNIPERVHWNGISATGQAEAALFNKFFNSVYQHDDPVDLNFERKELNSVYNTSQTVSNMLSALEAKKPHVLMASEVLSRKISHHWESCCLIFRGIVSTGEIPTC